MGRGIWHYNHSASRCVAAANMLNGKVHVHDLAGASICIYNIYVPLAEDSHMSKAKEGTLSKRTPPSGEACHVQLV